ncbi:MAG TPA: protein kinase [Gemmatimonadales bacterium]|nr:protein kinase [Gemmatimonadales bacterium]
MSSDLQSRLQSAVGATYAIQKELGGGGMSRVFLADEVELGRQVVIKVLPPEMAAGVNVDRFRREIQLAARLQHPHVVPLLTAGAQGDLLYYVMPFIKGESLRAKLAREGELPVGEAARILRDVTDALAHAHSEGVVHRDIKPDNVMISGNHALVTDFGVAKAVSESTGGSHLTSLGVALGTPAYMAPEQAVADPHVDHRADIYAVGALAYEMLTGRPPFTGPSIQAVLAAHVTDAVEPVTKHRTTVPPALNEVVLRCLAKKAADRYQRAEDLRVQFESMATPSGGVTPTGTQPHAPVAVPGATAAARTGLAARSPVQVAAWFAGTALVVLVVVYGLVQLMGLPDWVFVAAIALLAAGLPIMLLASRYERKRAAAVLTGVHPTTPVGLERHVTWSKALLGGGVAFGGLAVLTATYMVMRAFGIGPAATLMATGAFGQRELMILSDFANRTTDSTLGSTVTELLRVSFSESPVMRLADPARLAESRARMQLAPDARIDESVAREIAERESIKAIIAGEVVPLGSGYLISARLISATGDVLTAQQSSAASASELIGAVDQLSGKLRERIGESLRSIRRTLPLELVTTGSLRALRLYAQATQAEITGDEDRAIAMLDEAVAIDSTFAMAYRKIGTILANSFGQRAKARAAVVKAYELRDRLSERERGYAVAQYHTDVTGRREEALAAYRTLLEQYPDDHRALNNSGVLYFQLGDHERSRDFYQRALDLDSTWSLGFTNLAFEQKNMGQFAEAARTLDAMEARFPNNPRATEARGFLAMAQRHLDSAAQVFTSLRAGQLGNPAWEADASENLAFIEMTRGRFRQSETLLNDAIAANARRNLPAEAQRLAAWWQRDRAAALGGRLASSPRLDRLMSPEAMASLPVPDRQYEALIEYYALIDPRRARALLGELERSGQADLGLDFERGADRAAAWVLLAEGNPREGLERMRTGVNGWACEPCGKVAMASAHDLAGNADSSLHYWEGYVGTKWGIPSIDSGALPMAYRRLGELYQAKGDRQKAAQYYGEFVALWKDADAELQPVVNEVKQRMAGLVGEGR